MPKRGVLWVGGLFLAAYLSLPYLPLSGPLPGEHSLWSALQDSDSVELLSIEPLAEFDDQGNPSRNPNIEGWPVLGQTVLDNDEKEALVNALHNSAGGGCGCIRESCFNPRHAFRFTRAGVSYSAIICFECHQIAVYSHGKDIMDLSVSSETSGLFNNALKRHHLKLAPPPEEEVSRYPVHDAGLSASPSSTESSPASDRSDSPGFQ